MNKSFFNKLTAQIASNLTMVKELGISITPSYIDKKVEELIQEFRKIPSFECTDEDLKLLKFNLESMFNIKIGEGTIKLSNPDLPLWFNSKKSKIEWTHWEAYKNMLLAQARALDIIDENEKVIDAVLDYSGDPTTPGAWSRKGLVMGNVQSGKTQNFLGLINKAIDCGYKTIIVLGGHLNDLRKQTQERIDEGVLGKESKHLILENIATASPIGVGIHKTKHTIHTGTSTMGDFKKPSSDNFGIKLTGSDPVIFTIKKHTGVLEGLYRYIKDEHMLYPELGKKLDGPLLLIDDEADYASINTKHHKEEVTKTNNCIRELLSLFNRNTYVGYTATPFANIFIDPDDNFYLDQDDLFPRDFMIKIPVPDNYLGQDFFFKNEVFQDDEVLFEDDEPSSLVIINDHEPIFELKKNSEITYLPASLKEAVRAFILCVAIRSLRGESTSHNTMLVNISHLKDHQNQLEFLIEEYRKDIFQTVDSYGRHGREACSRNNIFNELEKTFYSVFNVVETYENVFDKLIEASGKIKTWAINQSNKKADNRELDYSKHKENGLSVIVIGGHKLSRGLTLEGLSISYFCRNSKAYDTLMQMCRWFGYRPTYKDLCRVYLPQESQDWYTFIAASIRELYQELDLMSRRGERPSDFGLKVREHPGAMIITAKNKIGFGTSEVIKQDLWGQIQRRFKFKESKEVNKKNIHYAERLINKLSANNKIDLNLTSKDENKPIIFSDVDYEDVIDFIKNIDLPEDDIGNAAIISHLKSMKDNGLKLPKVCIFNQSSRRNPPWETLLDDSDQNFINKEYIFAGNSITLPKRAMNFKDGNYCIPSVQLGNPDDEKYFLEDPISIAILKDKKAVNFDYLCADERDFPGLIIYLFAVTSVSPYPFKKDKKVKVKLAHGHSATLGFTLSIPRIEKLKNLTEKEIKTLNKTTKHEYKINKIKGKLREIADYEDYDDE